MFLMGEREGIHIEKTKVGDRYVLENMLENGYNIGGEQSGHIIFLDENTTGDGLLSALHLLQVMTETKKKTLRVSFDHGGTSTGISQCKGAKP